MPSSGYSWTEPLPRPYNTLGTNIRSAKTAPAAPLLVRDASPDSLISMFNEDENNMEWASSPNPDNDHLVLDDPESDISSASGCSASVSLVSSPSFEPALDSAVVPSLLSESHENTTYASRMHMSQFQREKDQFRWDLFVQRIKEGLPEKFTHQNKFFQLINFGGSGNLYATAFTVHRYYDTLAIKVLRSKKIAPIIDLPNEFQIMRDLKHNHIVAFVGTFSRNGQFGVLMYPLAICNLAEFLKDASEKKYSDSRQRFDQWKSILTTAFGCLSSALIYLHMTRRIKHKDIKPENILVDRYGSVLLSDFGISKQYEDETITEGTTPFTDKYAPPEVVHQHKRDLSSDIFSLGCVFLEMATVVLGESLEDLTSSLFDPNRRQSYREARPRIIDWVDRLKRIVRREAATSYSETFRSYTNSNLVRVQNLGVPHLDAVLSMMSISPRNRPPISKVHELFKGFASHCLECQDAHLVRSCNHQSESKIQVLPATLEEARAVDQNRSSLQALERQAFTLSNRAVKDNGQGYQNKPETSKSDSPMDIDETESACPSEAESLHSDSDSADDFRPRLHVGSERHAVLLQARIQPWLEQNKELILSSLHQNDNLDHCVRQCPANSSSGRSNGSSGSRRQGSPIKGPPDKRRSIENRRVLPLRNGDDNGGSDGEDDPDRGRDKSSNVDFNGSPRSRMFACPFYQRERSRHTNRSCQGPGWTNFHRVKEHLGRVHRIYRCARCQAVFHTKKALEDDHLRQAAACELRHRGVDDNYDYGQGYDDEQANQIKLRHRNVNEEEKWRRSYKILFPRDDDRNMPSPYCTDGKAEDMTGLATRLSQNIRQGLPQHLLGLDSTVLDRAVLMGIEQLVHEDQHRRDMSVLANSPPSMQQPTPEHTQQASEVKTMDQYSSEKSPVSAEINDQGNVTTDSACYAEAITNSSVTAGMENPAGLADQYPNGFSGNPGGYNEPFQDNSLWWSSNQNFGDQFDFSSYSPPGNFMYPGYDQSHDQQ